MQAQLCTCRLYIRSDSPETGHYQSVESRPVNYSLPSFFQLDQATLSIVQLLEKSSAVFCTDCINRGYIFFVVSVSKNVLRRCGITLQSSSATCREETPGNQADPSLPQGASGPQKRRLLRRLRPSDSSLFHGRLTPSSSTWTLNMSISYI